MATNNQGFELKMNKNAINEKTQETKKGGNTSRKYCISSSFRLALIKIIGID